jgi:hypothetical protein
MKQSQPQTEVEVQRPTPLREMAGLSLFVFCSVYLRRFVVVVAVAMRWWQLSPRVPPLPLQRLVFAAALSNRVHDMQSRTVLLVPVTNAISVQTVEWPEPVPECAIVAHSRPILTRRTIHP